MDRWIAILVLVALVAGPILFIWARRACIRRGTASLERIYAEAKQEAQALGPSAPRVTFKYHTYSGLLLHAVETEHVLELPSPVAERTLGALLRHNLTHGFFAEGVLVAPVLGYVSYLGQKRLIRRQLESPGSLGSPSRGTIAVPRPGPSGLERWGMVFLVGFVACGAWTIGVRELREAAANRVPLALACPDFVALPPADRWVRLTGASGALKDSAVRFTKGVADRVYVPLTCGEPPAGPIRMVLATEDPGLLGAVSTSARTNDFEHTAILPLKTESSLRVQRDIQGMVRRSKDHETHTTIGGPLEGGGCVYCPVKIQRLAVDYVVVEDGVAPSIVTGLAWLAGAVVGTVYVVKRARSPAAAYR